MTFITENKIPLLVVSMVAMLYGIFLYITFFIIQPGTFLSSLDGDILTPPSAQEKQEKWKIGLLTENFISLFSSGVSLSAIAPDVGKIATHPSVKKFVEPFWPSLEIAIFIGNVVLLFFVIRYASRSQKRFVLFLVCAIGITISMVILARPDYSIIPDFDYRYAGPPFYFYCFFLALVISIAIQKKKEYTVKTIVSLLIVTFAFQQIFSFHAVRLKEESRLRKEAIISFSNTLLVELERLGKDRPLVIPNLTGAHIFQGMPGYTLADYLLFFDKKMPVQLIQNVYMPPDVKTHTVETVGSLRASASPEFIDTLKKSGPIQSYYTSSVWLRYNALDVENILKNTPQKGDIVIKKDAFDPEQSQTVRLLLYTDDVSGNIELSFSFKNDFGIGEDLGKIRIDDYTPSVIKDNKRFYQIEVNLLQIYPYALSDRVSELVLHVPKEKNTTIDTVGFQ